MGERGGRGGVWGENGDNEINTFVCSETGGFTFLRNQSRLGE